MRAGFSSAASRMRSTECDQLDLAGRAWRKRVRRMLLILAAIGSIASPSVAAPQSSIVIDDTGAVLAASAPTALWRPASLTKLMTLYLAFGELAAGRMGLAEKLTVSAYAAAMPPSALGLVKGEKITVEDAILATITRSANDAAVVLAERIAGEETSFAGRMTSTARRLGMTGSIFRNATGLPDPEQTTTARDMAVLALALLRDFPQYYRFFAARGMRHLGASLPTINAILGLYPGADGLKTGFTCSSGYNLVASAVHHDERVIAVLLGGLTSDQRFGGMRNLLDAGFAALGKKTEDPVMIAKLTEASDGPPPQQLSDEECAPGWSLEPDGEVAGRLPGWGIAFGGFPKAQPTRALLDRSLKLLPADLKTGRPAVVTRQYAGLRSYRAVVVGLTAAQASGICHHLWQKQSYCRALSPQMLNNPRALWR
jgi:D-alanyl-D-alanine carboxypeptidase